MNRTGLLIVAGLLVAACTVVLSGQSATSHPAEEFTVEEYDFEWIVAKSGDAKLSVEKTQEATVIRLSHGMNSLSMVAKDAEAVGAVLAKTDDYWKKMKGSDKDVRESVEGGKHVVTFWNSPKYGFSVSVREAGSFAMSSVSLKRDEAKLFAPHMQKAQKMAAFVDRKITF
jgi:prophage DNA circulation protein